MISDKSKSRKIDYNPDVDIVPLFKLELQSILMNSKNLNTTITDILPYGSRILGLNIDNSDVDFSINYGKYYNFYILHSNSYFINCKASNNITWL